MGSSIDGKEEGNGRRRKRGNSWVYKINEKRYSNKYKRKLLFDPVVSIGGRGARRYVSQPTVEDMQLEVEVD